MGIRGREFAAEYRTGRRAEEEPETVVASGAMQPGLPSAAYDYLLVVGPGRSGSEFLFRNLLAHPAMVSPELKEGYYYRSPAAFHRARAAAGGPGTVLLDVANLGYRDPALVPGLGRIREEGVRILVVALLRHHGVRAESMMRFRRSRGEVSALLGPRALEEAVLRDRLTPERLRELYELPADLMVIAFPALVNRTREVLAALIARCGLERVEIRPTDRTNEAVDARAVWFSALGKGIALALRRLGFRKTLQRLKDHPRVGALFFTPLRTEGALRLSDSGRRNLERSYRECVEIVEGSSAKVAEGVYLRAASSRPPPAAGSGGASADPAGASR